MKLSNLLVAVGFILTSGVVFALGFPDQGFSSGPPRVRTDYAQSNEGTAANPLTRGPICLFAPCLSGPNVFSASNYWRQNWPSSCDQAAPCPFWVLGLNNEDAHAAPNGLPLNPGPPNASLPRSAPGSGIMGFSTLFGSDNFPGDTLWRAHLVLNVSSGFSNPAPGATPFLSLGAWTGHGTPEYLGYLNPASTSTLSIISFGERLWALSPPVRRYETQPATLATYLWITAKWGTYPKMIAVTLAHHNIENSTNLAVGHLNWNWNIQESSYYPGAEIVYIDAEDVSSHCPNFNIPRLESVGQEINYRVDPTHLFRCLASKFSEPFPTTSNIPITAVFWASEATGKDGGIWIDVHKMSMLSANQLSISQSTEAGALDEEVEFGVETAKVRRELELSGMRVPPSIRRARSDVSR